MKLNEEHPQKQLRIARALILLLSCCFTNKRGQQLGCTLTVPAETNDSV
jgi:hypothetical protein